MCAPSPVQIKPFYANKRGAHPSRAYIYIYVYRIYNKIKRHRWDLWLPPLTHPRPLSMCKVGCSNRTQHKTFLMPKSSKQKKKTRKPEEQTIKKGSQNEHKNGSWQKKMAAPWSPHFPPTPLPRKSNTPAIQLAVIRTGYCVKRINGPLFSLCFNCIWG